MAHTNNLKRKTRTHTVLPKKKAKLFSYNNHSDYAPTAEEDSNDAPVVAIEGEPVESVDVEDGKDRTEKAALITEYHALEKQLAVTTDLLERRMIENRQEELGGLKAYQHASIHGGAKVRGGESGKWCAQTLIQIKSESKSGKKTIAKGKAITMEPIKLLDVGAIIGTAYDEFDWIDTVCIDLNSQSKKVLQFDFFDFPVPKEEDLFDVVGLSLVINFVGSLTKRAEMLRHAHKYLKPTGQLYLVLPLPCIANSRYCDEERLTEILTTCGWTTVKKHESNRLLFMLLKREGDGTGDDRKFKKVELAGRGGGQRNNFCIVVA